MSKEIKPTYKIVNIVASVQVPMQLDLISLALNSRNIDYEPEQFPGAILKIENPKAAMLLFKQGKIICAGTRSKEELERAVAEAIKILKAARKTNS
ncbi:MAG: TATA-box-binding protein [Candidatus Micrarchaeota archaeon]|nr:MAG: TATA-box-binding protein [Candidatus Micrarchaeota archaeon]